MFRRQIATAARARWFLIGLDSKDGRRLFRQELPAEPLPDGLLVGRAGCILVTLMDGGMACYAGQAQQAGL